MTTEAISKLPDIQNQHDLREIPIDRVGITNVYFPIKVRLKTEGDDKPSYRQVSAHTKLFVGLPKEYKGINMSRFMESLVEFEGHTISAQSMPKLLDLLRSKLKSHDAYARFEFDYYVDRKAPVSKKVAPQRYRCAFTGVKKNGTYDFIMEVNVVAASLCPCSREMSLLKGLDLKDFKVAAQCPVNGTDPSTLTDISSELLTKAQKSNISIQVGMGAHNQRSNIRVEIISEPGEIIWLEDVIDLVEAQASAPVYPILKRPDEKYVTEQAYNNAKFSEDITRDVQIALEKVPHVQAWALRVYNEESIHPYDVSCYQKSENWKY